MVQPFRDESQVLNRPRMQDTSSCKACALRCARRAPSDYAYMEHERLWHQHCVIVQFRQWFYELRLFARPYHIAVEPFSHS